MTKLFVTEMLRWGDEESHHYIVGVYSTLATAKLAGEAEATWRGGKYEYRIVPCNFNEIESKILKNYNKCK